MGRCPKEDNRDRRWSGFRFKETKNGFMAKPTTMIIVWRKVLIGTNMKKFSILLLN